MSATSRSVDPLSSQSLLRIGFVDVDRARRMLAEPAVASTVIGEALTDMAVAADADVTLLIVSRLLTCEQADFYQRVISSDPHGRRRLYRLIGISASLGEWLIRRPKQGESVITQQPIPTASQLQHELLTAVQATETAGMQVAGITGQEAYVQLRRAYRCALLRIVSSDINDDAELADITRANSDLADAVLAASLAISRAETPDHEQVHLGIVAMGKSGAQELNYVSDVDVIFVAEPATGAIPEPTAMRIGTKLAQTLMNITVAATIEGAIWEVDAGLRPEGKSGALVRTLASTMDYYRRWAKTWEFQALLKARPAAGDLELAREFVEQTRPLVWEASRRPEFVADVQAMRRRVEKNIPATHAGRALKLGPGGIRDIEFSVQMLQMVHGSSDITVRSANTLQALEQLATWGYVARVDAAQLVAAYTFQRTLEHRLQLRKLRRTHTLPDNRDDLRWLGRSLGYSPDPIKELERRWKEVSRNVRRLHEKLFYRPLLNAVCKLEPGEARLTPQAAQDRLTMLGFTDPAGALRHLEALSSGVSRRAAIQRTLLPVMLGWFAEGIDPDAGLLGFRHVSESLGATPWYLRLLRDESVVAQRLAYLLSTSKYASDLLTKAPEAVRILSKQDSMRPLSASALGAEMQAVAERYANAMRAGAAVRAIRRRELFRISAANLTGLIDVEQVGQALSQLTDAAIHATLRAAMAQVSVEMGMAAPTRIAVIAMGRLGGREMSYASDADVMYVHQPNDPHQVQIAGTYAKRVITVMREALSVPSSEPPILLDADLRPEGKQGVLVRTLDSYIAYYQKFSASWEAQALLRARSCAGDAQLGAAFIAAINPVRYPQSGITVDDLINIRRLKARMESERLPRGVDPRRHLKLGPGGLSDVEWTVQLLQLQQGHRQPQLRTTSTIEALQVASELDLIPAADTQILREAWQISSRIRNAHTLVVGKASDVIPSNIERLSGLARVLGYEPGHTEDAVEEYLRATRRARRVFDQQFYGIQPETQYEM